MIGIAQRPVAEIPGLVPAQVRFVQQNAHQLGDGEARMGIVELQRRFFGKQAPIRVVQRKRRITSASEQATRKYS